jgi:uncharacterized protein with HEPN domain
MPRSDKLRLLDIQRAAAKIERIINEKSAFLADEIAQDAVAYNLLALGEACINLSEDFKSNLPEIPWSAIRGIRNLLAHEYFVIDPEVIFVTATKNVPDLMKNIQEHLPKDE